MLQVRAATADDAAFLAEMLAVAADWRPGARVLEVSEVMAEPPLAHYVAGWPRPGDFGVVADDDRTPVGAAWCRHLPADDPGYGFVAPDVPELSIGVVAPARGRGVGRALLIALVDEARQRGVARISLSVEPDNPAVRLYTATGFRAVETNGGATTMLLDVSRHAPPEA